jgi:branched-chain amino acid transport system ATP-binding protein
MSQLEIRDLAAFYGDFQALFGISLDIEAGECVAIIGANGAGKSTLLRSITGLLPVAAQAVRFEGIAIGSEAPHRIIGRGIAMTPEGRRLFPSLSVEDNLLMGGQCGRKGPWSLARIYALFPILAKRKKSPATALSGGQQQMVAIGRALLANPSLLLCDEISLGLAPIVIRDLYAVFASIRREGTSLVVVEQDVSRALSLADRVYCLQEGRVTLEGRPGELSREQIRLAYFGT